MIKNVRWTYVISDLNGEEIFEKFYKKELKKKKNKIKIKQRERTMNYILNRKATVILLTAGLIKRHRQLYKMSYFPEPHIQSKCKIEVELDLPKYAIKSDFKNEAGVDT